MHDQTGRLLLCARCQAQALVCSQCDRGQRYCSNGCANITRRSRQREAGRRYQQSRIGRHKHAARMHQWRKRRAASAKIVTHHGSCGRPCRCCTTGQRITPGNLARFTGPITMHSYRPGFHCTAHHLQHPIQHSCTGLELSLVPLTLSCSGAQRLPSPLQVGA